MGRIKGQKNRESRATTSNKRNNSKQRSFGASLTSLSLGDRWHSFWSMQRGTALESLYRMLRSPVASAVTSAVIAVALMLPALLYIAISNVQVATDGWKSGHQISLYLKMDVNEIRARHFHRLLIRRDDISEAQLLTRDDALTEFKDISGFGEVIDFIDSNPLPHVITITPAVPISDVARIEALLRELNAKPEVEAAELDMVWVKRLYALLDVGHAISVALAFVLGFAVLLVIGNTIRLSIESRRDEIVIIKLVGATDAFVSRPFIYTGVWFGVAGGVMAGIGLWLILGWLDEPVANLAKTYQSDFSVRGLGMIEYLMFLIIATILGWSGAFVAVKRHLIKIEPT